MSFTSIALAAYDGGRGRTKLATVLLDYERNAAEKVKLLLSMGQSEAALSKAVDSLDADLVFLVLLHLFQSLETSVGIMLLYTQGIVPDCCIKPR